MFKEESITGVIVRDLKRHTDDRGWLMELFRQDELPEEYLPVMAYLSMTKPGVSRGPHEHVDQADYFCFLGPSDFKLYLWDNRKSSSSYRNRQILVVGEASPTGIVVPAGVVHAYQNIGPVDGMVVNCANRLYAGHGRAEPVDEIRHERDPATIFRID